MRICGNSACSEARTTDVLLVEEHLLDTWFQGGEYVDGSSSDGIENDGSGRSGRRQCLKQQLTVSSLLWVFWFINCMVVVFPASACSRVVDQWAPQQPLNSMLKYTQPTVSQF